MEKNKLLAQWKQLRETNNLYPSLIISGKNQKDLIEIVDEMVRFLVCLNQSLTDDQCQFCRRAVKHSLTDVVYLGDGVNQISKEEIKQMMDQLTLSALEAHGKKICIIQNAENLKVGAANALLKFLEEPPVNTFAFLLTKDRTMILPTIKSRSQTLVLDEEIDFTQQNGFEKVLKTKNQDTYFLASHKFKKKDVTEFIRDLEVAYQRTIVRQFPQLCEDTLILINDLKTLPNQKLAIDNYFIKIAERI